MPIIKRSYALLNTVDKPNSHWLLKSVTHSCYFDALLHQYPNAALIMTHRCLEEVVPSYCRLLSTLDYFFDQNNVITQQILKERALEHIDKVMECILQFRAGQNNKYDQVRKTIFDVLYTDLMKNPITVVRQIYDHFGLRWLQQFEMTMETWLRDNPQGKQGRNTYSLTDRERYRHTVCYLYRYISSSIVLISVVFQCKKRTNNYLTLSFYFHLTFF